MEVNGLIVVFTVVETTNDVALVVTVVTVTSVVDDVSVVMLSVSGGEIIIRLENEMLPSADGFGASSGKNSKVSILFAAASIFCA